MISRQKVLEALTLVHYWEDRCRGAGRLSRVEAAKEAIKVQALNEAETDILLNTILVKKEEIA